MLSLWLCDGTTELRKLDEELLLELEENDELVLDELVLVELFVPEELVVVLEVLLVLEELELLESRSKLTFSSHLFTPVKRKNIPKGRTKLRKRFGFDLLCTL